MLCFYRLSSEMVQLISLSKYYDISNIYFHLFEALEMEPRDFGMEGKHLLLSAHPPQPSDVTG